MREKSLSKAIVIAATLDTKGRETLYLKEQIEKKGCRTVVIDTGILAKPFFQPDVSREEVARVGGTSLQKLVAKAERERAIEVMMRGTAEIVKELHSAGNLDGVIALGGSAGTAIGTAAMRALPLGVPKLMLSTIASRDVRPYVGTSDIAMMHSVTDILGLNRLLKKTLTNAAGAITGMVEADTEPLFSDKPLIAVSMWGLTTRCVMQAKSLLEEKGYEVVAFHATGIGGKAMEESVEQGLIDGVLDITTHELIDYLFGGFLSAGSTRLEAAGKRGIPQVIAPGGLDMINFGQPQTIPPNLRNRRIYHHNPYVTTVRTSVAEMVRVGNVMAEKLNKSIGLVAVLIPMRGWTEVSDEGKIFCDPEVDKAFVKALKEKLRSDIGVTEIDANINDPIFAETVIQILDNMMKMR